MSKNFKKVMMILFLACFTFVILSGNVFAEVDCSAMKNTTKCGGVCVPDSILDIIRAVVNIIKIGVPVILIVLGMIDMGKAVASQKEEDIKKGQKVLLSRCIAAGIVFFVVAIVQLLLNIISSDDKDIWKCVCQLVGNDASQCQ